jgi:Lrp/AsnC family leucine-responsive transcriptional regulator
MLDRVDETILRILEKDGRASFNALAEQIHLSRTPAWARVRTLERDGVIKSYRAELNPAALGLEVNAFVQVRTAAAQQAEFEAAVRANGSIVECFAISGEPDYLLHVLVPNIAVLDELLRREIANMPGVKGTLTMISLDTVKPRSHLMDCLRTAKRR